MAEIAGRAAERRPSWAIRTLYAVLALSALAFAGLIVGEVVYALEEDGHVHVEHDHGWYGPLFDAAWIVFLPTFALTLVTAPAALLVGTIRGSANASRVGAWGLAYCTLAVLVVVTVETLSS